MELLQMVQRSHRLATQVGVFNDKEAADAAVLELKAVGFTDSQIGVESSGCRTIIIVRAGTRADIASCVLNRFNCPHTVALTA
jgi:hypothetical protein